jgi:hypothetical protein
LRDASAEWERRGVRLTVIGNGNREQARWFAEDVPFAGLLLVDPRLETYRAAGLRKNRLLLFSKDTWAYARRAMKAGHRQTRTKGDPWQLGGVFVFAPGNRVLFEQRSATAGDHARVEDVAAALEGL